MQSRLLGGGAMLLALAVALPAAAQIAVSGNDNKRRLVNGVTTVVQRSTTVGMRERISGATTMGRFEPAATSECPPEAPRMMPSEPVMTLTLKPRSISSAERMTMSTRSQ